MKISLIIEKKQNDQISYSSLHIFWKDFPASVFSWSVKDRLDNSRNRLPKGSTFAGKFQSRIHIYYND